MRIGTSELILILIVALLALGPEKMPLYARKLGKALNSLKEYAGTFTEDFNENIVKPLEEVQKPLKEAIEPLATITKDVTDPLKDIKTTISKVGKPSVTTSPKVAGSENTEDVVKDLLVEDGQEGK